MTGLVGHFHSGAFGLFDIRDCFVWLVKVVLQMLAFISEPKLGQTQVKFILMFKPGLFYFHWSSSV